MLFRFRCFSPPSEKVVIVLNENVQLIEQNHLEQISLGKFRPIEFSEVKKRMVKLPKHKIRETNFTTGAH